MAGVLFSRFYTETFYVSAQELIKTTFNKYVAQRTGSGIHEMESDLFLVWVIRTWADGWHPQALCEVF